MKRIRRSKTIWFSSAVVLLGIIEVILANFSEVRNIINPDYYGVALITIGAIGVVLRFYTSQPIGKDD